MLIKFREKDKKMWEKINNREIIRKTNEHSLSSIWLKIFNLELPREYDLPNARALMPCFIVMYVETPEIIFIISCFPKNMNITSFVG